MSSRSDPWNVPEQGTEVEPHLGCGPGSRGVGRKAPTAVAEVLEWDPKPRTGLGAAVCLLGLPSWAAQGTLSGPQIGARQALCSGSQFPLLQTGPWTCCLKLLHPPSPSWERKETVPTPSLARDPEARLAQLEEAGWRVGGPAPSPSRGTGAPGHSPGLEAPSVTQASWKRLGGCRGLRATPLRVPPPTAFPSHRRPFSYTRWALTPCPLPQLPGGSPSGRQPPPPPSACAGTAAPPSPLWPGPAKANMVSLHPLVGSAAERPLASSLPGQLPGGRSAGNRHAGLSGCPGLPAVTSPSPPHGPREPRGIAPALPGLSE